MKSADRQSSTNGTSASPVPPVPRISAEPFPRKSPGSEDPDNEILCEIMAIVRPERREATKKALESAGILSYSTFGVLGRGRQKGLRFKGETTPEAAIRFLPRQMFMMVVRESQVQEAVSVVTIVNQSGKTGQFGDGKIFVVQVGTAFRISTGETGGEAI